MNNSYTREIAAALLIDVNGNVLLQQRDNILHIIQPGKVGLFGGGTKKARKHSWSVLSERSPKKPASIFLPNDFNIYSAWTGLIRRDLAIT